MQDVSAEFLAVLRSRSRDLVMLVEFYSSDAVPSSDGFDPDSEDFLFGYSDIHLRREFRNQEFKNKVKNAPDIKRTLGREFSNVSVILSNLDREVATYELSGGFEGLIMVIRIISLSVSENLDDSIACFTGRCEKPQNFDRGSESVSITAKHVLASTDVVIPRRKFTYDDDEGRLPTDPLFEGFRFLPQYGSISYSVREKRGGLFGLLGFKKTVQKNLQYSSHSALDAERVVPLALGRPQMQAMHVAYADAGTYIKMTSAFCEALRFEKDGSTHVRIAGYENLRVVTPGFVLNGNVNRFGELGGTGDQLPAGVEPTFPGRGYYSRTAFVFSVANGSTVPSDDPAPDLVAVIIGSQIFIPDEDGNFEAFEWTDNAVYQARGILTSPDYWNLDENWLDDETNFREGAYCDAIIIDSANTDVVLLPEAVSSFAGTDFRYYKSTGAITPDYFKKQAGLLAPGDEHLPFLQDAEYLYYESENIVPIEPPPPDDDDPDGSPTPTVLLRRRYTSSVCPTDQQKAIDFLYNTLFASSRLFMAQNAKGKLGIKVRRPVDNTLLSADVSGGADEIAVFDVEPWVASLKGYVLIGAHQTNSEVRKVVDTKYTGDANDITLAVSEDLTPSGGTFHGGNETTPAIASVTVDDMTVGETAFITIQGYKVKYVPVTGDTVETVAGFLAAMVNSHFVLQKFVTAVWNLESQISLQTKLGSLVLETPLENEHAGPLASPEDEPVLTASASGHLPAGEYQVTYCYTNAVGQTLISPVETVELAMDEKITVSGITLPADATSVKWFVSVQADSFRRRLILENDGAGFVIDELPRLTAELEPTYNSTAEEILRVMMSFSDKGSNAANTDKSNMLSGSFKFPMGGRQKFINRIDLKYFDAANDWRPNEIRVLDKEHKDKVKKALPEKIDGSAIDNYHQAKRVANGELAVRRDGDFFSGFSSDGEALLLEEFDLICYSDESGGLRNLPLPSKTLIFRPAAAIRKLRWSGENIKRLITTIMSRNARCRFRRLFCRSARRKTDWTPEAAR